MSDEHKTWDDLIHELNEMHRLDKLSNEELCIEWLQSKSDLIVEVMILRLAPDWAKSNEH